MASTENDVSSEIKPWLEIILKDEQLDEFSLTFLGNSEKGDGYMGDIFFVTVNGRKKDESRENYNLVLKCSKRNQTLRELAPIKEIFLTEMFIYQRLLPYMVQFQQEKAVKNPFVSFPKCYGSYIGENIEVIALENLKNMGYELWPKKWPLTRKHIDMVVTEYGKFHATSVALQHQRPKEFEKLVADLPQIDKVAGLEIMLGQPIDESYELLKNDLDEETLRRWKGLKQKIPEILDSALYITGLKVFLHGDCWNNNFMFFYKEGDETIPLKTAFLDWQVSRYGTPIADLAYFLIACASESEFLNLNDVLFTYHNSFANHLKELGMENANAVYPRDAFLEDWRKYSKYGILMAGLVMKVVSTEKDEVVDIADVAERGRNFTETFTLNKIRDKNNYRNRIRPIVQYVVKNNLI